MVGRVIASESAMQGITVVPPEGAIIVPQFGKARFGAPSYDAAQVDAWVGEVLSKNNSLHQTITQLQAKLSTQDARTATLRQSSQGVVASKDLEISRKDDEIKSLNDKIANLKADLVKERSRNSLTGVADELDALRNKTQSLCDKRIAEAKSEAQGIKSDANEYSQAKRSSADEYSANTKAKADEYSKNTRADADNYAETVKAAADDKAQGIIDDASKRCAGMVEVTKKNIKALRNKSFGVIEKASKAGIDKLVASEEARSSVAKLLADLSAQVASFSNTGSDVLKELKDNTIENLSAEFDSNVLDATSDAQTVDDVLAGSKNDKEPVSVEEPASAEELASVEESASAEESTLVDPPAPPVRKAATLDINDSVEGINSKKSDASEVALEETVVLPVLDAGTQEEIPEVTSEMSSIGLEAVADLQ